MKELLFGMRAYLRGAKFIVLRPRNWPLASIPALVALVAFTLLATLSITGGLSLLPPSEDAFTWGHLKAILLHGLVIAVALVASALIAFSVAQPLSGGALETLSRRFEEAEGLTPSVAPSGATWRTVRVTVFALVVTVPLLVVLSLVGLLAPPALVVTIPLKVVVSSFALAWDLLDYPLSIHGLGVRERLRFVRAHLGAVFGLGLAASLSLLVPGLGLLLLPVGVVGATDLSLELYRKASEMQAPALRPG
jgi:CysZ protein